MGYALEDSSSLSFESPGAGRLRGLVLGGGGGDGGAGTLVKTTAEWAAYADPIPLGVRAFNSDTYTSKTGDDVSTYAALPYDKQLASEVKTSTTGITAQNRLDEIPRSIVGQTGVAAYSTAAAAANTTAIAALLATAPVYIPIPPGSWYTNKIDGSGLGSLSHSVTVEGRGAPRYNSRLQLQTAADCLFDFGNGGYDAFSSSVNDLAMSGGNIVTNAVVRRNRGNFIYDRNKWVADFIGATGEVFEAGNAGTNSLMQEWSFTNCAWMARELNTASNVWGNIGVDVRATGNGTFSTCNSEGSHVAFKLTGKNAFPTITFSGGYVERCDTFAIEGQDVSIRGNPDISEGAVWLGDGCAHSKLHIGHSGNGNFNSNPTGINDNGSGNEISRVGGATLATADRGKAPAALGHWQTGNEWDRVPDLNPYFNMQAGLSSYTAKSATMTVKAAPPVLPGLPSESAGGLLLNSTAANDYVEFGPFAWQTGKDVLGLVHMLVNRNNHDKVKVGLYDQAGTLLVEKDNTSIRQFTNAAYETRNQWRFVKLLACAIASAQIKLRITLTAANIGLQVNKASLKPSEINHLTGWNNTDSNAGAGALKKYRRVLTSTNTFASTSSILPAGVGTMSHMMTDLVAVGTDGFLGEGGTHNAGEQRQLFRLPQAVESREWTWFTPNALTGSGNARMGGYSFVSGHTVDFYEGYLGRCYPYAGLQTIGAQLVNPGARMKGYFPLPAIGERRLLHKGRYVMNLTSANTGDAGNYWTINLYSQPGGGVPTALFSINNQSATWSPGAIVEIPRSSLDGGGANRLLLVDSDHLYIEIVPTGSPAGISGTIAFELDGRFYRTAV